LILGMLIVELFRKIRGISLFIDGRYACSVNAWLSIVRRLIFKLAQVDAASSSEN
jgi:hypothetical protein